MGIPTEEQETVIQFSRHGPEAIIDTTDSTMINKLNKLVEKSAHYSLIETHVAKGEEIGRKYQVDDKKLISFRSNVTKQNLSEEQRAKFKQSIKGALPLERRKAMSEHMKQLRKERGKAWRKEE